MGRIVAVANQKGGVGKTTTAISLGAALAIAERLTLLVDIDPQSSSTKGLGLKPAPRGGGTRSRSCQTPSFSRKELRCRTSSTRIESS